MATYIELSSAKNLTLLRRVLRYFLPYKGFILLSLLCIGVIALCTAGTAWLIRPAMDEIFVNRTESALILVPAAYVLLSLFKGLGRYGQNVSMNYAGLNVLRAIRTEVFAKLIRLPLGYFEKAEVGALMSHVTYDVAVMQRSLPAVIVVIRQTLTMLGLIGVVFYQNYRLALWALIALPLAAAPVIWFNRKLRKYGRRNAALNASITSLIQEMLSGVRVIKAFATERDSTRHFDEENLRLQRIALHQNMVAELASPCMELIAAFGVALIMWYGGMQVLDEKMTAGAFFSFVAALLMLYDPFKSFNSALLDIQNALAGAERVFGMLDSVELGEERGGDRPFDGPFRELCFRNVTFAYAPEGPPALKDATVTIRAGERVALVGPSGAGKTTFVNLIPRFFVPQSGTITLNGRPLEEYDLTSLRRAVAVVSQEAFLFNLSVSANIAFGSPDAGEEDIRKAARAAFADHFVRDLPDGYATVLGERGARLSGGQRQRLTIARAIAKNAHLLILDEATSSLDSEAESLVQQALDNLMAGRTTLVIAHRLSTVLGADRILVMDRGVIADCGTHAELLQRCELYARLYALQFRTES
jgi:subfamily B ATP-binding cassette protein MsbA